MSTPGALLPGPRRSRGFTLVELMVVLVILGLMGGAIALTLPGQRNSLEREVEALAARMVRAQEEAILGTRAVQVTLDAGGYRFERQDFGRWQALADKPFAPARWQPGTQPRLRDAGRERISFVFDPVGGARAGEVVIERDGRRMTLVVDETGEVEVDAGR